MQRATACCFVDVCINASTVQSEMWRASISRSPEATVDRQAGQLSMCTQTCTPMQSLAHIWHVCIFGHIWHMYKAADQTSILTTLGLHHIWFLCLHGDKKYSTEHILTENTANVSLDILLLMANYLKIIWLWQGESIVKLKQRSLQWARESGVVASLMAKCCISVFRINSRVTKSIFYISWLETQRYCSGGYFKKWRPVFSSRINLQRRCVSQCNGNMMMTMESLRRF